MVFKHIPVSFKTTAFHIYYLLLNFLQKILVKLVVLIVDFTKNIGKICFSQ